MAKYIVTYDLKNEKNYKALIDKIKTYNGYCKLMDSTWVVGSKSDSKAIKKTLRSVMDKDDVLFVAKLTTKEWSCWLGKKKIDWLEKHV